jgi:hypothetical protein
MVNVADFSLTKFQLKRLTDFLAFSIFYYAENFKLIFKQILIPQFVSVGLIYFLYKSLYGEFNLTYFLSSEGKIFLVVLILFVISNLYNTIYQSIKLVVLNNLELRLWKFKTLLLILTIFRLVLFLTMLASIFFDYTFIFMFFAFLVLNTYFYQFIFNEAEKNFSSSQVKLKFFEFLKLNFKAFMISIVTRALTIFLPLFATFSIFIVYEFVRILITGKVFFFVVDRWMEFQIWLILTLLLFLIANPFQYLTMMIFHKYCFLKELNKNLEQNI